MLRPIGRDNCPHEVLGGQPGYHGAIFSAGTEKTNGEVLSNDADTDAKVDVIVNAKALTTMSKVD